MTKQTNVDELLPQVMKLARKVKWCESDEEFDAETIIALVRQHDKSQRNDVLERIKARVTALARTEDYPSESYGNGFLDCRAKALAFIFEELAIEALKNK